MFGKRVGKRSLGNQGERGKIKFEWILGEEFIRMGCSVKVSHKPANWRSLVLAARSLCIRLIIQWISYKCNLNAASCCYVCHPNGKELVSGSSGYKNRYVTLGALHSDCGPRTCWFGRTCWADRCTAIPRDPPTWLCDENAIHVPGEVHIEWHMHGHKFFFIFIIIITTTIQYYSWAWVAYTPRSCFASIFEAVLR